MSISKKILKFIIALAVLFISIVFITKSKLDTYDTLAIALIGCVTFAALDQYAPSYVIEDVKRQALNVKR